MSTAQPTTLRRLQVSRFANLAAILGITAAMLVLSQWWSGLDTPDSEFYLSLSIFTDQITDRSPVDSYFWTRLGYIAPAHLFTTIFGIWPGFAAWKALQLALITGSAFFLIRQHARFINTVWLTATISTSSVMVAYLGNSYITAPVMTGTAVLMALATRPKVSIAAVSGVVLGWLAMSYPGGALLGGTVWLALLIHSWRTQGASLRRSLAQLGISAITTASTLALFLATGAALFPGLNWFETYIEAAKFDYGIYSSGEWVWLRDISLLVPASVLVLTVINWATNKASIAAQQAMVISLTSIAFILTYSPFFGAHFLEAPPSQAMLWPPALFAIALVGASRMREPIAGAFPILIAALGLALILGAGYVDPNLTFGAGLLIAAVLIALVLLTPRITLATVVTLSVFLAGSQLLQNSREPMGQFMLSPYNWAYRSNPVEEKLRTAVNAQQWVLENTTPADQIMQWVEGPWVQGDRELYTVASMQLWGPNLLTLEPTLDEIYGRPNLEKFRPTVIEMNGKSMQAVLNFWESLPAEIDPTAPICYDYSWPIDPRSSFPTGTGHTCLTSLTWR